MDKQRGSQYGCSREMLQPYNKKLQEEEAKCRLR